MRACDCAAAQTGQRSLEANDLFAAYMVQIEHVIVAVDNLDTDAKQKTAVT